MKNHRLCRWVTFYALWLGMADRQPGRGDGSCSRENAKGMATGRMSVGQGGGGRIVVPCRAESAGVLCGKYSNTLRQVLEYSPQSTIRDSAERCPVCLPCGWRFPLLFPAAGWPARGARGHKETACTCPSRANAGGSHIKLKDA